MKIHLFQRIVNDMRKIFMINVILFYIEKENITLNILYGLNFAHLLIVH